ncbi:hypothetical protein BAE44_0005678 [Dichanthelium oligosanthes]|uniref:Secreted protein n=1 Tax=Dichanthelium oligosanthes TaxID=888268 RepID=A0A1E5W761_9POAL|nr:hypothetical protein BAE44_0005678 [Dichanthelium oligosanthes]
MRSASPASLWPIHSLGAALSSPILCSPSTSSWSVKCRWSLQCSATSGVTPKAARYGACASCSINCLFKFLVVATLQLWSAKDEVANSFKIA